MYTHLNRVYNIYRLKQGLQYIQTETVFTIYTDLNRVYNVYTLKQGL